MKGGRCEACQGDGVRRVEMHFLPDVYVGCETCKGRRYNRETLEVLYRGKSIADVLDLTVAEAAPLLFAHPRLKHLFDTMLDVGLGYLRLGQSGSTLSGGEAQRVKLARELGRRETGRTLYLLDEPTTGLHFDDVRKLLHVLSRLVEAGNTVVVIEHNLDVVKTADHVIDLGPEAGEGGGRIVAEGSPEEVARSEESHTARYLRRAPGLSEPRLGQSRAAWSGSHDRGRAATWPGGHGRPVLAQPKAHGINQLQCVISRRHRDCTLGPEIEHPSETRHRGISQDSEAAGRVHGDWPALRQARAAPAEARARGARICASSAPTSGSRSRPAWPGFPARTTPPA